jgi:hypothetical protein
MYWNYGRYEICIVEKVSKEMIVYWLVSIEGKEYWVIRKIYTDARIYIANELKGYLGLEKNEMISCFNKGRSYVLIKSFNPHTNPELTLRKYSQIGIFTDDLYIQAQKIFAFKRLLSMSHIDDTSILVRKRGRRVILISYLDVFTKKDYRIPEITFNKWFRPSDMSMSRATELLLNVKYPASLIERELNRYNDQIQPLIDQIDTLIQIFDPGLVWMSSDVNHYLILRNSPSLRY